MTLSKMIAGSVAVVGLGALATPAQAQFIVGGGAVHNVRQVHHPRTIIVTQSAFAPVFVHPVPVYRPVWGNPGFGGWGNPGFGGWGNPGFGGGWGNPGFGGWGNPGFGGGFYGRPGISIGFGAGRFFP
ncbi:MAG: hypothetical protein ACRCZF_24500 [Gemmataceae bacterium]